MQPLHGAAIAALLAPSALLSGCVAPPAVGNIAIDKMVAIKPHNEIGQKIQAFCGPDAWGQKTLDMSNITDNILFPECTSKEIMRQMDEFNKANGGVHVSYKSRPGKDDNGVDIENIDLVGWWLPAPMATPSTPRIVLQHGFVANSNTFSSQFIAYQLRSMGFSVLVNNFRDHCYSANSTTHIIEWGRAYPLDLLGAWDYAKNIAGGSGPIKASKVGILGISMGGFTAANAMGLEPQVPAAWMDSPPFTPRDGFEIGFKKYFNNAGVPGFISGRLTDSAWAAIMKYTSERGVNLNTNLPEHRLPQGPDTQRPVFIVSNSEDSDVPFSSTKRLADLVEALPSKYILAEFWVDDGECAGRTHAAGMVMHPAEYAAKMCKFWWDVFAKDTSSTICSQLSLTRWHKSQEHKTFKPTETTPLSLFNVFAAASAAAVVTGLAVFTCRRQLRRTAQQVRSDVERDAGAELKGRSILASEQTSLRATLSG